MSSLGALALLVAVTPLPVGTDVDYQLGGPVDAPANVGIVVRDRTEKPQAGRYNICYVNGFQTQPDAKRFWRKREGLLLHDRGGRLVVDAAWGEWLFDVSSGDQRRRLARIVGRWVDRCATDGYDAVEFDNLDSFTRSRGLLRRRHALRHARLLVRAAHDAGLAAGQKNVAGYDGTSIGFDFAVAEECGRYDECGAYVDDYGDQAVFIEYRRADFRAACDAVGESHAVVLRDRNLSPSGVRRWC
jgi:hypothetical protein